VYLKGATKRVNALLEGWQLDVEDVYRMQEMCAYETVSLGYSPFCTLFDSDEWDGFDYSQDLAFYHTASYSSPFSIPFGAGYLTELVARLTHTPIKVHNTSTNSTLDDNEVTFPLNDKMYVDATHDSVLIYVITALNLTQFNEEPTGSLPSDRLKTERKFKTRELCPFAGNIVFQVLERNTTEYIRVIINDGVVPPPYPCPGDDEQGLCELEVFVSGVRGVLEGVDWAGVCVP